MRRIVCTLFKRKDRGCDDGGKDTGMKLEAAKLRSRCAKTFVSNAGCKYTDDRGFFSFHIRATADSLFNRITNRTTTLLAFTSYTATILPNYSATLAHYFSPLPLLFAYSLTVCSLYLRGRGPRTEKRARSRKLNKAIRRDFHLIIAPHSSLSPIRLIPPVEARCF